MLQIDLPPCPVLHQCSVNHSLQNHEVLLPIELAILDVASWNMRLTHMQANLQKQLQQKIIGLIPMEISCVHVWCVLF